MKTKEVNHATQQIIKNESVNEKNQHQVQSGLLQSYLSYNKNSESTN